VAREELRGGGRAVAFFGFGFCVFVFNEVDVDVACGVDVAREGDVVFLVLVFQGMFVAVTDVQADGDAAVLLDVAVDFEGAVKDVFCVFAFELEKGFVTGAEEAEDLVLTLGAHLTRVFVFFGEGVAKGLLNSGARDNDVAGCVWAGYNL
jgi:hypothetical protein